MKFKLRKIGNSFGIIIPKDIVLANANGGFIDMNVITFVLPVGEKKEILPDVITFNTKKLVGEKSLLRQQKTKKDLNVCDGVTIYEGSMRKTLTKDICKKHKTFKYSCGCK